MNIALVAMLTLAVSAVVRQQSEPRSNTLTYKGFTVDIAPFTREDLKATQPDDYLWFKKEFGPR